MENKTVVWAGALMERGDGRYLFVKRERHRHSYAGKWQLPGGLLEWGEAPEQALHREVTEETGGSVSGEKILGAYSVTVAAKGDNYHAVHIVYSGKYNGDNVALSHEHEDYRWVDIDEALSMDLADGLGEFISENVGSIQDRRQ